jgi:precorrin-6B methylase 2
MRIEYHRTLIADQVRNDAFYAALQAVIVPGKTVVADIGSGTGLLGLMASKLGAKAVYMFETAQVAGVAEKILKANRVKTCHLIPCHSTEFRDQLQVDVIVSETLGNYAFEENIIDTLNDARRRFLKPGGTILPSAIRQHTVPVIADRIDQELRAWQRVGKGLDLNVAQAMSFNNVYVRTLATNELLGDGKSSVVWDSVDFSRDAKSVRKGEANWRVSKQQTIYGLAYWWVAELGSRLALSTGPDAPRTHWEQLYFPLLDPMTLKAGDQLNVSLKSRSSEEAGTHLAWTATHLDSRGKQIARQALDLDKGFLP